MRIEALVFSSNDGENATATHACPNLIPSDDRIDFDSGHVKDA